MVSSVFSGNDYIDADREDASDEDVRIVAWSKHWRTSPDVKIKTEILNEIENFSANDELNVEECAEEYVETDLRRNTSPSFDEEKRRKLSMVSLKAKDFKDENINFEKCMAALTTGGLCMCSVCKIEFKNEVDFKTHMIGHSHGKLFQCGFCGQQFSRSPTLKKHLWKHSRAFARKNYDSEIQGKETSDTDEGRPQTKKRFFKCNFCKKQLLHRQSLRDHELMHTNVKPFECAICKKQFIRPSSLRAHTIVHTADSPYRCDVCPAKFKRSSVLKTHKLTHTDVRKFECDICKQRFHLKGALKHHILAHYGVRPYECKQCGKCYRRSWGLKVHMYRHTGVKRFECDLCKARFSVKTKLAKHIYRHIGEKPYKCDSCGRQFGERYLLRGHKCLTKCVYPRSTVDSATRVLLIPSKMSRGTKVR